MQEFLQLYALTDPLGSPTLNQEFIALGVIDSLGVMPLGDQPGGGVGIMRGGCTLLFSGCAMFS